MKVKQKRTISEIEIDQYDITERLPSPDMSLAEAADFWFGVDRWVLSEDGKLATCLFEPQGGENIFQI